MFIPQLFCFRSLYFSYFPFSVIYCLVNIFKLRVITFVPSAKEIIENIPAASIKKNGQRNDIYV